jgi:hypothetical protein
MAVHLSEQSQADYSDYLKRFQENPHSISAEEAVQRYTELVRQAPPELAAEANQHIMGLLPQNDREVLADNIHGSPQTFGLLDNILGKDSVLNTPMGKMILSAVVAYLANRMLGQSQSQGGTRAPSGGLGDLISTILNGAASAQSPTGDQTPAGGGLPSGLGDILGALLGGQAQAGSQAPAGNQAPAGGGLPGGLGDILGALMGGASADAPNAPAAEPEPDQQPPIRSHRKQ